MSRWMLAREAAELVLMVVSVSAAVVLMVAAGSCVVGGRAPSPSPGVLPLEVTDSEAAPARSPAATTEAVSVGGGNGEDGDLALPLARTNASAVAGSTPAPASTVTQSALTAVPSATAYVVIDAVPATPPASASFGASSASSPSTALSALIAASPWPQSLWGTVACLVQRESRGVATAVGGAGERGLMQVHPITWPYLAQYGITPDALFDPATNLRAGYLLFIEAGGLRPWNGGCA